MPIIYGSSLPPGKDGSTKGEVRIRVEKLLLEEGAIQQFQDEVRQQGGVVSALTTFPEMSLAGRSRRSSSYQAKHSRNNMLSSSSSPSPSAAAISGSNSSSTPSAQRSPNRFVIPVHHCAVAPLFSGELLPSAHCIPTTASESRGVFTLVYPIKEESSVFSSYLKGMETSTFKGLPFEVFVPSSYSGRQAFPVGRAVLDLNELTPRKTISGWFTLTSVLPIRKSDGGGEAGKTSKGREKEQKKKSAVTKKGKEREEVHGSRLIETRDRENGSGKGGPDTFSSTVRAPLGRVKLSVSLTYFSRLQVSDHALSVEGSHLVSPPRKSTVSRKVPASPSSLEKKKAKENSGKGVDMEKDRREEVTADKNSGTSNHDQVSSSPDITSSTQKEDSSLKNPPATASLLSPPSWSSEGRRERTTEVPTSDPSHFPSSSPRTTPAGVAPHSPESTQHDARCPDLSTRTGSSTSSSSSSTSSSHTRGEENHYPRRTEERDKKTESPYTLPVGAGGNPGSFAPISPSPTFLIQKDELLNHILKQGQELHVKMHAAVNGGGVGIEGMSPPMAHPLFGNGIAPSFSFPSSSSGPRLLSNALGGDGGSVDNAMRGRETVDQVENVLKEIRQGQASEKTEEFCVVGGAITSRTPTTAAFPPTPSYTTSVLDSGGLTTQERLLRNAEQERGVTTSEVLSRMGLPHVGGGVGGKIGECPSSLKGMAAAIHCSRAVKEAVGEGEDRDSHVASTLYTSEDSDDEERFTAQLQHNMEEEGTLQGFPHRTGTGYSRDSEEVEVELMRKEEKEEDEVLKPITYTPYSRHYAHGRCHARGGSGFGSSGGGKGVLRHDSPYLGFPSSHPQCCSFGISTRRAGVLMSVSLTFSQISFPHNPHTADMEELRINVRLSQDISTAYPSPGPFSSLVHPLPFSPGHLICLRFDVGGFSEKSKLVLEFFNVHSRPILAPGTSLLHSSSSSPPPRREIIGETPIGLCIVGLYQQEREIALLDPVEDVINAYAHFTIELVPILPPSAHHHNPLNQELHNNDDGHENMTKKKRKWREEACNEGVKDEIGYNILPAPSFSPHQPDQAGGRLSDADVHVERISSLEKCKKGDEGVIRRETATYPGHTFAAPRDHRVQFSTQNNMLDAKDNRDEEKKEWSRMEQRRNTEFSKLYSHMENSTEVSVPTSLSVPSYSNHPRHQHSKEERGEFTESVLHRRSPLHRKGSPAQVQQQYEEEMASLPMNESTRLAATAITDERREKIDTRSAKQGKVKLQYRRRVEGALKRDEKPPFCFHSSPTRISDQAVGRSTEQEEEEDEEEEDFIARGGVPQREVKGDGGNAEEGGGGSPRGGDHVFTRSSFLTEAPPAVVPSTNPSRAIGLAPNANRVAEELGVSLSQAAAPAPPAARTAFAASPRAFQSSFSTTTTRNMAEHAAAPSPPAAPSPSSGAAAYFPSTRLPGRCRFHIAIMGAREIPQIAVLGKDWDIKGRVITGEGEERGQFGGGIRSSPPPTANSAYVAHPNPFRPANGHGELEFKQSSFVNPNIFFVVEEIFSGLDNNAATTGTVPDWIVEASTGGYYDRTDVVYRSTHPTFQYECIVSLPQESVWLTQSWAFSPSNLRHAAATSSTTRVKPAKTEKSTLFQQGNPLQGRGHVNNSGRNGNGVSKDASPRPCLRELQLTMWHQAEQRDAALASSSPPPPHTGKSEEEVFWSNAAYIGECRVDLRPLKYLPSLQGYYRITATGHPPLLNPPKMPTLSSTCMGYVHLAISLLPSDDQ